MFDIDKQFRKVGFYKRPQEGCSFDLEDDENDYENKYGVYYERRNRNHNYTQVLCIIHKSNGNHLIQSYQKDVNSDGFNNVVGLNYKEMKLAMRKYKQMKRKYGWK